MANIFLVCCRNEGYLSQIKHFSMGAQPMGLLKLIALISKPSLLVLQTLWSRWGTLTFWQGIKVKFVRTAGGWTTKDVVVLGFYLKWICVFKNWVKIVLKHHVPFAIRKLSCLPWSLHVEEITIYKYYSFELRVCNSSHQYCLHKLSFFLLIKVNYILFIAKFTFLCM